MEDKTETFTKGWLPLCAAWLAALVSTLSALFIGEVMGQTPCVLCWFQRIFMFPLVLILGLAAWRGDTSIWKYGLLLAAIGWLIAAFHTLLYFGVIPEPIKPCTATGPSCSGDEMMIFGFMPIPLLALVSFTLICALLWASRERTKS